jgi:hypothetical protein
MKGEDTYSVGFVRKSPVIEVSPCKGPNSVGVFPHSPEDGNRSSFRNIVFSSLYNTGRWKRSKNPGLSCIEQLLLTSREILCFIVSDRPQLSLMFVTRGAISWLRIAELRVTAPASHRRSLYIACNKYLAQPSNLLRCFTVLCCVHPANYITSGQELLVSLILSKMG